ncbi:BrnA antitoxin family protein [Streptomyces zaomyceticus]|uniref:BrnA antitoxin family protein n=1 Tax=Streptomyces zaomyceticus TaxID=68286 RepID=A0ABZ1L900_9ACTN|nr:BrnA antitoxin family protein [Streptomyces zaomyceticus]
MGSTVLSLRIDGELLDRLRSHAAKRGMSVQDYVVRTLIREDFDERFKTAVDETEKFYGDAAGAADAAAPEGATGGTAADAPCDHVRPSAGIA